MIKTHYRSLAWQARRTLTQYGTPAVIGLGLLAFCTMLYFSALMPLRKEVHNLQSDLASAPALKHPTAEQIKLQPDRQLESFYETFPSLKDFPDALEKIHDAALAQGVSLEQGEYHLVRNGTEKLLRYEISLPIKSDYVHLRKFVSQVLADMPYLSLDSIDFQKQKASDTSVDAQVKMTVFLVER